MTAATCVRCSGAGSIEYDRGDDCLAAVVTCSTCAGQGFTIAPRDAALDAKMLSELRQWRTDGANTFGGYHSITDEELDMLLAIADERDELKAAIEEEFGAPLPAVVPLPAKITAPMPAVEISIEPDEPDDAVPEIDVCRWCGERIVSKYGERKIWAHQNFTIRGHAAGPLA